MTFQVGRSGNPKGRPKGTGSRQELFNCFIKPHQSALFEKAVDMALNGNESMLKLLLERMLPAKPKDEPINFSLGDISNTDESLLTLSLNVLTAVSLGQATPTDCRNISTLIAAHHKNIGLEKEIHSVQKDLAKLKA